MALRTVPFKLPEEVYEQVCEEAGRTGVAVSGFVRRVVGDHLQRVQAFRSGGGDGEVGRRLDDLYRLIVRANVAVNTLAKESFGENRYREFLDVVTSKTSEQLERLGGADR